jgi:SGNH hydrolase-like domain, acetyltransferase AlgX
MEIRDVQKLERRKFGIQDAALVGMVAIVLVAIAWCIYYWTGPTLSSTTAAHDSEKAAYEPEKGFPPLLPSPAESAPAGPEVRELRAVAIQRTADALRAECLAHGDWSDWQQDTAPSRKALKAKLDTLRVLEPAHGPDGQAIYAALEGLNRFPLFEVGARDSLKYLLDPQAFEAFRRDKAVLAVRRWLQQRNIDLIFVAIPKMTEVYVDEFLAPCPPDGIIAPHLRQALLELLNADVEVVDGFALFRLVRNPTPEYLYNTCEGHWAPRAMRIMAKEVADRVQRYPFGSRARFALPIVTATPGRFVVDSYWSAGSTPRESGITLEQFTRAKTVQTTREVIVRQPDGSPVADDAASPVLLMGNSFVQHFQEQLVREMNLKIRSRWSGGQTTEAFADFLRQPEALSGVRVVVWITTEQHMTHFKPLPPAILAALDSK